MSHAYQTITIIQRGIALGLLFILVLNCGRMSTDINRGAEYSKEILRDIDHLSDNGLTVASVTPGDCPCRQD